MSDELPQSDSITLLHNAFAAVRSELAITRTKLAEARAEIAKLRQPSLAPQQQPPKP